MVEESIRNYDVKNEQTDTNLESLIDPDDAMHTLFYNDARLKLVGEELANDTGRAILLKLREKPQTVSELAKALEVTVQLVAYHIERLEKAGLVEVKELQMSQKGKEMKQYKLGKLAVLLVLYPRSSESKVTTILLKKLAMKNLFKQILMTIGVFAGGFTGTFSLQKLLAPQGPAFELPAWVGTWDPVILLIPTIVGVVAAVLAWIFFKRNLSNNSGKLFP